MNPPIAVIQRRPVKQSRGRAALLWAAGLFVAAQAVGGWLLDRYGQAVRFPNAIQVWADVASGPPPSILWMGSSRSEGSIRNDAIDEGLRRRFGERRPRFYNGAVQGGDPYALEPLLGGFLARYQRPEILILEIAHDELTREGELVGTHLLRQATWADLPELLPQTYEASKLGQLIHSRALPLHLHRRQLRLQLLDRIRPLWADRSKPFEPWGGHARTNPYSDAYDAPPPIPAELTSAGGRIDFGVGTFPQNYHNFRIEGYAPAALDRLLTRCEGEGISVVLVVPPFSHNLRELFTPDIETCFQDYLAALRRRHPFDYVDLRDSLPDAAFADGHHMSLAHGGILYSHVVLERVVLPALERKAKKSTPPATVSRGP